MPFVPVTPATRSSAVGSPQKRAATGAIAARASPTRTWGTGSSSSRSTTSAAAPASTAAGANRFFLSPQLRCSLAVAKFYGRNVAAGNLFSAEK